MKHPALVAALADLDAGKPMAILRIAIRARMAAEDGRRCECVKPELVGADLMCSACLLENRDQERRAVDRLVNAHDFEPGKLGGRMCAICSGWAEWPRHNGVDEIGRCSWGERRQAGRVIR